MEKADPTPAQPLAHPRPMGPRDWFEVGLRLLGVWVLISVVNEIRTMVLIRLDLFTPERTQFSVYAIHAVMDAAVGIYLLFWTHHLAELVFGKDKRGFDVVDKPSQGEEALPQLNEGRTNLENLPPE